MKGKEKWNKEKHNRRSNICWLKQVKKPAKQIKKPNISLTFLSSYLQHQKQLGLDNEIEIRADKTGRNQDRISVFISQWDQPTFNDQIIGQIQQIDTKNYQSQRPSDNKVLRKTVMGNSPFLYKSHINSYESEVKTKKLKGRSLFKTQTKKVPNQQKSLLNELISDPVSDPSRTQKYFYSRAKGKKHKKMNIFEQYDRKKTNKSLFQHEFKSHFQKDNKQKPQTLEKKSQTNVFISKPKNSFLKKTNESFLQTFRTMEQTMNPLSVSKRNKSSNYLYRSSVNDQKIDVKNIYDNVLTKMGFKQVEKFKWSKISHSKFKFPKKNKKRIASQDK